MISDREYNKILTYFDEKYWVRKIDKTNWQYDGLILDRYFQNSPLNGDYLDIFDFFDTCGGFSFVDDKTLSDQYKSLPPNERLLLLQNILNIFKFSTINKEETAQVIEVVSKVLKRDGIEVVNLNEDLIALTHINIIGSGSYCNIVRFKEGVVKKEMNAMFKDSVEYKHRLKTEYDIMKKLEKCPQILNVYDFDEEACCVFMEEAEMNLATYISSEIDLQFDKKLKVVTDILKGMTYAHNYSIIHRDLHPGNILKIKDDFVICDFGLGKDLTINHHIKSSCSEKNNHIYVDPSAASDFTKLDEKSDIFSLGMIINYIMTNRAEDFNHVFKTIVEICTKREKSYRYDSVDNIISEIEYMFKGNEEETRKSLINRIINNQYNKEIHDFIINLVEINRLNMLIVTHNLFTFSRIILQFNSSDQKQILDSISNGFVEATGYGMWQNYDIFSSISYELCTDNSINIENKKIARCILEKCAKRRFSAQDLLKTLLPENIKND